MSAKRNKTTTKKDKCNELKNAAVTLKAFWVAGGSQHGGGIQ